MPGIFIHDGNRRLILETVKDLVTAEMQPRAVVLDAEPDFAKFNSWKRVESANAADVRTMTLDEKSGGLGTGKLMRVATTSLHSDGVNRTLFLKAAHFVCA